VGAGSGPRTLGGGLERQPSYHRASILALTLTFAPLILITDKATRDQARADAERAEGALDRLGQSITPAALKTFARTARRRMRTESGGYRRDHLRALAQRVEVDAKEVRIMGSKSALLRTLVAVSSAKTAGFGVPSFVPKWRARRDSNS
jgi:site-specific DNA recombinase